ncbi:peptide deformylase [Candidatus Roizmanbacteria bacterium RIFOXYB2_FULL_41_10]|uniref:Peptide deformylase n=1 Tax=Candidatus Roizmanbacteria bacterium RIFOXYA1_FULL_41_12 TaxID=1802082 RepID=A0A1F7KAT6_9BACT|nr:MAG: peptide deformylase [Candidatus Roizmanbacteria bacterium RIFOXYA1_FULL_41_12]OGK66761.1 MAG: peptide deformylase [Candidatus Roizmanbacteria bacterium RIFOXYB1_FULL_41_27]OGK67320.1 MAG: peptide deformylase [Candidatus Roizmanbacteria bacterium RIFOXYA2_FULL_41_8]OGK70673.1 MAG: peptide deformylase [Candidatus Roizmanbacteria bacterium RIFOXYB2_FULL_41_10]OGK70864.1 MAG: peptide deformylase [Candidatus Roizmanbacteria bacterium RIFOXYC1_FULL_41_16]OGK75125.1 MAG: peptide deformylase [
MKLNLVTTPNPVLNQPTAPIVKIDQKILAIVKEMKRVLNNCTNPEGVGLAAPQVGLSLSLFLTKPYPDSKINTYLNPKIIETATQESHKKDTLEGCLSITNTWANVKRPKWVILEYQSLSGEQMTKKFSGWEAQIIQHEMDHLKGILFTHRALEQAKQLYRIEKNNQGEEELVSLEI